MEEGERRVSKGKGEGELTSSLLSVFFMSDMVCC